MIASKNRVLCESLVVVLNQHSNLDVMCNSCNDSSGALGEATPDVVLVDAGCYCLEDIADLPDIHTGAKIIVFGFSESEMSIVDYAMAGVSGFVHANASLTDLSSVIQSAASGELDCSPKVAGLLLSQIHRLAARERNVAKGEVLTAREKEIAGLVGRGYSNKQIARSLSVQDNTVKNHVHSILGKMGMHRRGELIARLHRIGTSEREVT